jgi:hypothetical protein
MPHLKTSVCGIDLHSKYSRVKTVANGKTAGRQMLVPDTRLCAAGKNSKRIT